MTYAEMERMILNDGYGILVVSQMTNEELEKATSYEDYQDYTRYMQFICHKYDR